MIDVNYAVKAIRLFQPPAARAQVAPYLFRLLSLAWLAVRR